MEKMTKRAEQAREMKNRILRVAVRLFGERGFANVSISDIAEAAGCSTGNIYHYFRSKEDIALHTIAPMDDLYMSALEDTPPAGGSVSEQLISFLVSVVKIDSESDNLRMGYVLALKNPGLRSLWISEDRPFYKLVTAYLEKLKAAGEIRSDLSLNTVREQIIAITRGILVHWVINLQGFDVETESRRAFEIFLRGIR